ncbi:hypothetical protein GCM10027446_13810 [Angustibacter peucedani]
MSRSSVTALAVLVLCSVAACSDDGGTPDAGTTPSLSSTATATATATPSTTSSAASATSVAGGAARLDVVTTQYGTCLTKLGATPLVDVGDGRSVTSTINDGAVTLRWTVLGGRASVADEATADFLGTAGC